MVRLPLLPRCYTWMQAQQSLGTPKTTPFRTFMSIELRPSLEKDRCSSIDAGLIVGRP